MWLSMALGLAMAAAPLEPDPEQSLDGWSPELVRGEPKIERSHPDPDTLDAAASASGGPANLVVESRTAFRSDLNVGATFGLGLRAQASPRWAFESVATMVSLRGIRVNGPQRGWFAADLSASMLYLPRPWLAVGPTAGISYRVYRQQWNNIGQTVMPAIGLAGDATVLRARWFALGVAGRVTGDLGITEYVLETSQVLVQSPWDVQLGIRTTFGWPMAKSERPARKERR